MTITPSRPAIAASGLPQSFGERLVAKGTPIDEVVGEGPVELAVEVPRNHPPGQWTIREGERLTNAIERAAREDIGSEERAA
jgi:hypothetical protein